MITKKFYRTIKGKLLLFSFFSIFLIAIIIGFLYFALKNHLITAAEKTIKFNTDAVALKIEKTNLEAITIARTMALAHENGLFGNRKKTIEFIKNILVDNPDLTGVSCGYEPNADQEDLEYLRKNPADKRAMNKNGRFLPYWFRKNSEIILAPLIDMETELYYQGCKDTNKSNVIDKSNITEPYIYEGKMIVEFIYPISINNKFAGMTGADKELTDIVEYLNLFKPYKSSEFILLSRNGKIISSSMDLVSDESFQKELNKKKSKNKNVDVSQLSKKMLTSHIKNTDFFSVLNSFYKSTENSVKMLKTKSDLNGNNFYYAGAKIPTGDWTLIMRVSESEIIAPANAVLYQVLAVSLGFIILLIFISFNFSNKITKPINNVINASSKIAKGDFDIFLPDSSIFEINCLKKSLIDTAAELNEITSCLKNEKQQLAEKEENLRITLNSIGDAVITTDINGCVTRLNPVAETLTGWLSEDAKNKPLIEVFNIVHAKTRKVAENPVEKVIETGKIVGLANHTVLIAKDGTEYQIADSAAPIKDSANNISGVVLVFRDVTKEYQVRDNLAKSEEYFRSLMEQSPIAIQIYDKDGFMIDANQAWVDLWKIDDINNVIGKYNILKDLQLSDLKISEQISKAFNGELINIPEVEFDPNIIDFSGRKRFVKINAYPLKDSNGSFENIVVFNEDITYRKQAEKELKKTHMLKSVGALAGGIAHDFNNILTGIFGNISIAKAEIPNDHPGYVLLEEAEKSMNRATRLTKQLLTFAKGGLPIKENTMIGQIVKDVVNFDLSGSNVLPVFDYADSLWTAEVDKGQIQQVFSNLAINADQAMPEGGHLFISIKNTVVSEDEIPNLKTGKYIKIDLRDEGTGIDSKYLDRIFEPYFSTKHTGSGLGLATTFSIINKHKGHISVKSKLGVGTTFTILLPASEKAVQPDKNNISKQTNLSISDVRILVMDDEDMILKLTSRMLQKTCCQVETATDGEKAIEIYKNSLNAGKPFDVVIMDLTVPGGIGGKEAIKHILEIDPEAKVIVSSGYADCPVMANYSEYGFKGIIAKPYTINKLKDIVNQVITNTVS